MRSSVAFLFLLLGAVSAAAAVTGDCDVLDVELEDPLPALFVSDVDLTGCDFVSGGLSPGGAEILTDGTAGGSSVYSEILAYEFLRSCEAAALLKTETEIVYDSIGPLTDLLVSIDGVKIGVSVTRAIVFPPGTPITLARATELLEDKLGDVLASSANVSAADAWQKQILVVATPSTGDRDTVVQALGTIDATLRADTIVWVVQTDGDDDFLYFGDDPGCTVTAVPSTIAARLDLRVAPNPFNPNTTIRFTLAEPGPVTAVVFDLAGRAVRTLAAGRDFAPGRHALRWDGRSDAGRRVASGVYVVRVHGGGVAESGRLILVE